MKSTVNDFDIIGQYNLILGFQFGGRANFFTSDTILIFIYNIHNL